MKYDIIKGSMLKRHIVKGLRDWTLEIESKIFSCEKINNK